MTPLPPPHPQHPPPLTYRHRHTVTETLTVTPAVIAGGYVGDALIVFLTVVFAPPEDFEHLKSVVKIPEIVNAVLARLSAATPVSASAPTWRWRLGEDLVPVAEIAPALPEMARKTLRASCITRDATYGSWSDLARAAHEQRASNPGGQRMKKRKGARAEAAVGGDAAPGSSPLIEDLDALGALDAVVRSGNATEHDRAELAALTLRVSEREALAWVAASLA